MLFHNADFMPSAFSKYSENQQDKLLKQVLPEFLSKLPDKEFNKFVNHLEKTDQTRKQLRIARIGAGNTKSHESRTNTVKLAVLFMISCLCCLGILAGLIAVVLKNVASLSVGAMIGIFIAGAAVGMCSMLTLGYCTFVRSTDLKEKYEKLATENPIQLEEGGLDPDEETSLLINAH